MYNIIKKHMLDYFESIVSPTVKDACRYIILKEFNANIEGIKSKLDEKGISLACSTLLWLVDIIKCHDRKLFEIMLKVFCEDTNLHNSRTIHIVNISNVIQEIVVIICTHFQHHSSREFQLIIDKSAFVEPNVKNHKVTMKKNNHHSSCLLST
jgi:hypothetical protein